MCVLNEVKGMDVIVKKNKEKKSVTVENEVNTKNRKKYVAEKKNVKKEKKCDSVFKKISSYFKGVMKEIKRIRWTNSKDLFKYSLATVVFVVFFGLYFYAIDWIVLLVRSLAK